MSLALNLQCEEPVESWTVLPKEVRGVRVLCGGSEGTSNPSASRWERHIVGIPIGMLGRASLFLGRLETVS